jgi:hypothetical protein
MLPTFNCNSLTKQSVKLNTVMLFNSKRVNEKMNFLLHVRVSKTSRCEFNFCHSSDIPLLQKLQIRGGRDVTVPPLTCI